VGVGECATPRRLARLTRDWEQSVKEQSWGDYIAFAELIHVCSLTLVLYNLAVLRK